MRARAHLAGLSWYLTPSTTLRRLLDLAGVSGLLADPALN